MCTKNFNKILVNKNILFKNKKSYICDKIVLKCFVKKKDKFKKKIRFKNLWPLFIKLENLTGCLPILNKINIKIKNKKKKARSINFLYLKVEIMNHVALFFDFFFIKNLIFNLHLLYTKKYKFSYSQEIINVFNSKKISLVYNQLSFIFILNSFFSNLKKYKKVARKKSGNLKKKLKFEIFFTGLNVKYILNFINIFLVNNNKVLLFYYKSLRNKKIKI